MLSEEKGHIFVGQATQWKDMADYETVTLAPSGFFSGYDHINTCMHCDSKAIKDHKPGSYAFNGTIAFISSDDVFIRDYTAFIDQGNNHSNGAISKLVDLEDFSTGEFEEGVQFTKVEGKCTEPTLYPPTIEDQIYFINEKASTALVIPTAFSYGP